MREREERMIKKWDMCCGSICEFIVYVCVCVCWLEVGGEEERDGGDRHPRTLNCW